MQVEEGREDVGPGERQFLATQGIVQSAGPRSHESIVQPPKRSRSILIASAPIARDSSHLSADRSSRTFALRESSFCRGVRIAQQHSHLAPRPRGNHSNLQGLSRTRDTCRTLQIRHDGTWTLRPRGKSAARCSYTRTFSSTCNPFLRLEACARSTRPSPSSRRISTS